MGAKQFFKSLSWLLFLNLLIKPAWVLLIDRRVQIIVGHEVYGTYFALFSFTYILLFIADAGLTTMLTQRLAAREALNVRQLFTLKLFLLCFYGLTCTGIALLTGITDWEILLYLVLIQSLSSLFVFLRGLLTAQQHFKTDAFFSVLDKTLLLLLCIGPAYGLFRPMTMQLFLQLQTISVAIAVCCLLFFLYRSKGLPPGNNTGLRRIAAWVAPFILLLLLMAAHNRLDAFLLERLHPDGALQAGIYAMAYRLLDASNMLGYLTTSFLFPFLSRNRQDQILVQKVVLFTRHGLLFLSAVVLAFVSVYTPWLQELLYHSTDSYSNTIILLTLAALPAYYLIHIYGTALTAIGSFREFIQIILFAVATNVVLNLWLIPQYGALGCCIAALASQYGSGLALWLRASRNLQISVAAGTAALYPAAALIFGLLFYAGQKLTDNVWIVLSSITLVGFTLLLAGRNSIKNSFLPFLNKLHA